MDQNKNGIQTEAADAYFANYFESSMLAATTLTVTKPKAKKK